MGIALLVSGAFANPVFDLAPAAGMPGQAIAGFTAAAARWSALLADSVTVRVNIGFEPLGGSILGQASTTGVYSSYGNVRAALGWDAKSRDDAAATGHLQSGSSVQAMMNLTVENPNGSGSATPYLDDNGGDPDPNRYINNNYILMARAQAAAMGFTVGAGDDGSITFNSDFAFDFDPSNGITPGAYDFVGVATHEIGHVLGFLSGVNTLDSWAARTGTAPHEGSMLFSALDLFRYSSSSYALAALDWSADARAKYFSLDGGATALAQFATGTYHGDGRQPSHWKDNLGIGVMDPTSAPGELLQISATDLRAMDVIGWDMAIPEPGTIGLCALGLCVAFLLIRRRAR